MTNTESDVIRKKVELIVREFKTESDRAVVIVASVMLDEGLKTLLKAYLTPSPTREDSLFDGPNAPMYDFSSRIDCAYRLGLISEKFCRDLHIIRRIRNDFAHNITGCTFKDESVKNRIFELRKSFISIQKDPTTRSLYDSGERGDFQLSVVYLVSHLAKLAEDIHTIDRHDTEGIYK
jgi:DNA-binding MltR family transcriptional regulator